MTGPVRHVTELQIAASLVPGAPPLRCEVPGCTSCATRIAEAQAAADVFRDRVLPRSLPRIRARMDDRARGFWASRARWWVAPMAFAAAAAIAFAVWPHESPARYLARKGDGQGSDVRLFVRRDLTVREVRDGGTVEPGDALRFLVEPRGARFVLVVSIDGAGHTSVYHPFDGTVSAVLSSTTSPVELDGSIVLDDVLGDERLWVLLSDAPVPVDRVRPVLARLAGEAGAAVTAAGATVFVPDLPGVRVVTVRLHKVAGAGSRPQ